MSVENWTILGIAIFVFECLGIVSAGQAVLRARTSQGAIAWTGALITLPVLAVPLYWVFGRSRFQGFVNARRTRNLRLLGIAQDVGAEIDSFRVDLGESFGNARVLEKLAHLPFICGNDAQLLVDGEQTFAAMFRAIDEAQEYVLAEFFIINDDQLGREFRDHLLAAARRGCRVYLLYDDVGSQRLTRSYISTLTEAGVHVTGMRTNRGWNNRFQLNFRNHRKTVVIDGRVALVGGHNIGDEYIHRHSRLTPWRDTHMRFTGPAALAAQITFLEDWNWATGEKPSLAWQPVAADDGDKMMFILPSGPDDEFETCGLFFTHAINAATQRIWIASPYFVPDEGIITALQLAALRGVDVRVLIPGVADKWLVKRAAMAYVPTVAEAGVKVYEYGLGFMHQKVVLIDDAVSVIGTANFDNRSFRLNFEMTVAMFDGDFASGVEEMLERDMSNSSLLDPEELRQRGVLFQVSCGFARLFSPIL